MLIQNIREFYVFINALYSDFILCLLTVSTLVIIAMHYQNNDSYSKFFTGNKETLLEGTKRQGINLRQQLVKFYESYYSANQMSLAVVAPQSISQLRKFVSEGFGNVPNRNVNPPEDKWAFQVSPYGKAGLVPAQKTIVEIVPIQELRQVTITWPIIFASKEERTAFRLNKVCYSQFFLVMRLLM